MSDAPLDTLAAAGHAVPRMPMGTTCAVHTHRSYVPMEKHHVWPLGMGGPNAAANLITVCCNGHYEIHEYMRQLILTNDNIPWDTAKHFAPKVRAYATSGWGQAGKPTHGGGGE